MAALLAGDVVIEEKVDGANLGLWIDASGEVRVQNRGNLISPGSHPQFGLLWPWLATRLESLSRVLGRDKILFGEWCFAVHSLHYDRLPDWFLGFDVYDRGKHEFWSSARRDALFAQVAVVPVPRLDRGHFSKHEIVARLDRATSRLMCEGPPEGFYLRREDDEWLAMRAKIVRREFVQAIDEHWTRKPLRRNRLALKP
ncbi:RNA ligase family protein [Nannocystaceae bacterium ST9]